MEARNGGVIIMTKLFVLTIVVSVLTGFTSVSDELKAKMEQMPQHYSQFDAKLGWAVTSGTTGTTINGIIKNVRYEKMENIEIWASLLDSKGKLLARSVDYIIPTRLDRDDLAPFTITLSSAAPAEGKLIFTYKYSGEDGSGDKGGDNGNWMQSFEDRLGK
jgi:hypothetical protein